MSRNNAGMSKTIDWERIEIDYRKGVMTLREMASQHGLTEGGIRKRAKTRGWKRDTQSISDGNGAGVALQSPDLLARPASGFVYAIYIDAPGSERFYKIGMSERFSSRFDQHQCSSPFEIRVACAYFVGDMRYEEKALHKLFESKRVRGEWFRLTANDIAILAERAILI